MLACKTIMALSGSLVYAAQSGDDDLSWTTEDIVTDASVARGKPADEPTTAKPVSVKRASDWLSLGGGSATSGFSTRGGSVFEWKNGSIIKVTNGNYFAILTVDKKTKAIGVIPVVDHFLKTKERFASILEDVDRTDPRDVLNMLKRNCAPEVEINTTIRDIMKYNLYPHKSTKNREERLFKITKVICDVFSANQSENREDRILKTVETRFLDKFVTEVGDLFVGDDCKEPNFKTTKDTPNKHHIKNQLADRDALKIRFNETNDDSLDNVCLGENSASQRPKYITQKLRQRKKDLRQMEKDCAGDENADLIALRNRLEEATAKMEKMNQNRGGSKCSAKCSVV